MKFRLNSAKVLLSLFLANLSIHSKAQFTVSGTVLDHNSRGIPNADIIFSISDSIMASDITEDDGRFSVVLQAGSYLLQVKYNGEFIHDQHINIISDTSLGNIMVKFVENLDAVTLVGQKKIIERKNNRLIYNVENSPFAKGIDGLNLLQFVPRLKVTQDEVRILGKNAVTILIDNRLVHLSGHELIKYLESLRSENIEKIEVITNPSSRYDAAGNSGILNIILKKDNRLGYEAVLTSQYQQGYKPSFSESVRLNMSSRKLVFNYNGNVGTEKRFGISPGTYTFSDLQQEKYNRTNRNNVNLNNGADVHYTPNKSISMGVYANHSLYNNKYEQISDIIFRDLNTEAVTSQKLPNFYDGDHKTLSMTPYIDFKLDSLNRKIKLSYNFINKDIHNTNDFIIEKYDGQWAHLLERDTKQNTTDYNYKVNALNIDIEHPNRIVNINYGFKYTDYKTDNNVVFNKVENGILTIDTDLSNHFNYNEEIVAGYIDLEKELSDELNISLGVRYESTKAQGELLNSGTTFTNRYKNFFPSFAISWEPSDEHSYSISYNERIDRPGVSAVNPFRVYQNSNEYLIGNPYLLPIISKNAEINYNYNGDLDISLYYSHYKNNYDWVLSTENNNEVFVSSPLNFYSTDDIGLNVGYMVSMSRLFAYNSFLFSYQKSRSTIAHIPSDNLRGINSSIVSNINYVLSPEKGHRLFSMIQYSFPSIEEIYKTKSVFNLSFGGNFQLISQKLLLSVMMLDVFNTTIARNTVVYRDFVFRNRNNNDNRRLIVNVIYSFGNKKVRKVNRTVDQSESGRL